MRRDLMGAKEGEGKHLKLQVFSHKGDDPQVRALPDFRAGGLRKAKSTRNCGICGQQILARSVLEIEKFEVTSEVATIWALKPSLPTVGSWGNPRCWFPPSAQIFSQEATVCQSARQTWNFGS